MRQIKRATLFLSFCHRSSAANASNAFFPPPCIISVYQKSLEARKQFLSLLPARNLHVSSTRDSLELREVQRKIDGV